MRKILLAVLMFVGVFAFGEVRFEKRDIEGDDNGPGTYIYPENRVFEKQCFDLIEFKIEDDKDLRVYKFIFTIPINFKNEWKNANGWDVQMFDVYMNFGKSKYHQTIAGRNLYIPSGWDKVLVVSPAARKRMLNTELLGKNKSISDDLRTSEDIRDGIMLPETYTIKGNKLEVTIKKDKLKSMKKLKSLQVLVMGAEGFPRRSDSYNRIVNELVGEWRFGGGSDYYGDTNAMDVLGDNDKLANYKSTEDQTIFATVDMIKVK